MSQPTRHTATKQGLPPSSASQAIADSLQAHEQQAWLDHIPSAPIYTPTAEEWADPLSYIRSIQLAASPYGMCIIRSPVAPAVPANLVLEEQNFKMRTRQQVINDQPWTSWDQGTVFWHQNKSYTLREYQNLADEVAQRELGGGSNTSDGVNIHLPPRVIENKYWQERASKRELTVEYGNDLEGTGFYAEDPLGKTRWNLNTFATQDGCPLRWSPFLIPGVTTPMLYIGMLYSTFCWHVEDHYLYSINYHHAGATKVWYTVPGTEADAFENIAAQTVYKDASSGIQDPRARQVAAAQALVKKTTMFSPQTLVENNIKVYKAYQQPGDFIVTFPRAYHGGFSCGFNIGEAVNFATGEWWPYAECARQLYRRLNHAQVVAHEHAAVEEALHIDGKVSQASLVTTTTVETVAPAEGKNGGDEIKTSVQKQYLPPYTECVSLITFKNLFQRVSLYRQLLETHGAYVVSCCEKGSVAEAANMQCTQCGQYSYLASVVVAPKGPHTEWKHVCLECAASTTPDLLLQQQQNQQQHSDKLIFVKPFWDDLSAAYTRIVAILQQRISQPGQQQQQQKPTTSLQQEDTTTTAVLLPPRDDSTTTTSTSSSVQNEGQYTFNTPNVDLPDWIRPVQLPNPVAPPCASYIQNAALLPCVSSKDGLDVMPVLHTSVAMVATGGNSLPHDASAATGGNDPAATSLKTTTVIKEKSPPSTTITVCLPSGRAVLGGELSHAFHSMREEAQAASKAADTLNPRIVDYFRLIIDLDAQLRAWKTVHQSGAAAANTPVPQTPIPSSAAHVADIQQEGFGRGAQSNGIKNNGDFSPAAAGSGTTAVQHHWSLDWPTAHDVWAAATLQVVATPVPLDHTNTATAMPLIKEEKSADGDQSDEDYKIEPIKRRRISKTSKGKTQKNKTRKRPKAAASQSKKSAIVTSGNTKAATAAAERRPAGSSGLDTTTTPAIAAEHVQTQEQQQKRRRTRPRIYNSDDNIQDDDDITREEEEESKGAGLQEEEEEEDSEDEYEPPTKRIATTSFPYGSTIIGNLHSTSLIHIPTRTGEINVVCRRELTTVPGKIFLVGSDLIKALGHSTRAKPPSKYFPLLLASVGVADTAMPLIKGPGMTKGAACVGKEHALDIVRALPSPLEKQQCLLFIGDVWGFSEDEKTAALQGVV